MTVALVGDLALVDELYGVVPVIAAAMASLQAQLAACVDLSIHLGLPALSISAQLEIAAQIVVALNACLVLGITPPSLSAQLTTVLAVIAQLQAELVIFTDLFDLLAAHAIVYTYDGQVNAAGAQLTAEWSGGFPGGAPTDHANMLILGTSDPAAWAAISSIFKVTP